MSTLPPSQHKGFNALYFQELLLLLLRKWPVFLVSILLTTGLAYLLTWYVIPPIYQAHTVLFLGKATAANGLKYDDIQYNNQLITDYQIIVKSRPVAEKTIANLDLDMDWATFSEQVDLSTLSDSRMFTISFSSSAPQSAVDISNELVQVFMRRAAEVVEEENVKIIEAASLPEYPVSPDKMQNLLSAAILGFILALVFVFLREFMNKTIRTTEEIRQNLGLHVFGTIPQFEGDTPRETLQWEKTNRLQMEPSKRGIQA